MSSTQILAAPTGGMSLSQTACPPYWRHVSLTDCMPPLLETCLSHRLHAAPSGGMSLSQTAVPSGGNSDMSLSQTTAPIITVEACLSHKILPLSGGYSLVQGVLAVRLLARGARPRSAHARVRTLIPLPVYIHFRIAFHKPQLTTYLSATIQQNTCCSVLHMTTLL